MITEGEGKDKRERIIVVFRSPCQENYPANVHPSAHKSVLESANPAWTRSVHLDAPGQQHGQQPVSGTADPGVVKQEKSSRGSVDTTKTRSDPQRVRMSSGERPIGAAKGKQPNTEALCQTPPPLSCTGSRGGGGVGMPTKYENQLITETPFHLSPCPHAIVVPDFAQQRAGV